MKTLICDTCKKTSPENEVNNAGGCPECSSKKMIVKEFYQLRFLLAPKYKFNVMQNSTTGLPPENLAIWDTKSNIGRDDFDRDGRWCQIYAESYFKVDLLNNKGEKIAMLFPQTSDYKHWLSTLDEAIEKAIKLYCSQDIQYIYKRADNLYEIDYHYEDPSRWIFLTPEPPPVAKVERIDNIWVAFTRNSEAKYGETDEWIKIER